jgi:hypothetical protein
MREREESSSNAHTDAASKRSLARYFGISEEPIVLPSHGARNRRSGRARSAKRWESLVMAAR